MSLDEGGMSKFFDMLSDADHEFNALDRVVVLSIGNTLFDSSMLRKLWPDAEPLLEGSKVGELIELAFDREEAAKARGAEKAAQFFAHVVDALVKAVEKTASQKDGATT